MFAKVSRGGWAGVCVAGGRGASVGVGAGDLAPGPGAQGVPGAQGDAVLDEPDRAVEQEDIRAAGVE
jgi:hypothetical protein